MPVINPAKKMNERLESTAEAVVAVAIESIVRAANVGVEAAANALVEAVVAYGVNHHRPGAFTKQPLKRLVEAKL